MIFEIIERTFAGNFPRAFESNPSEIPTGCRFLQLAILRDVLNVFNHIAT